MTTNQLQYHSLRETQRANVAREQETYRYNVASLDEVRRHNLAQEKETNRNNLVVAANTVRGQNLNYAASRYASDSAYASRIRSAQISANTSTNIARLNASASMARTIASNTSAQLIANAQTAASRYASDVNYAGTVFTGNINRQNVLDTNRSNITKQHLANTGSLNSQMVRSGSDLLKSVLDGLKFKGGKR